jgi:hypothetical protein
MYYKKIVAFILLLAALCGSAYVLLVFIPSAIAERSYEGAKQIGRDINELFQFTPEITVNNTVVLNQQTSILELATAKQNFRHVYEWQNEWLGSTKKIKITGILDAKSGFDLKKKFRIDIDEDQAVIYLPEPQVLSVEPSGEYRFEDEHGVWNWVNGEDRSKAISAFHLAARKYAEQSSLPMDAKRRMEEQLREIMKRHGKAVVFKYEQVSIDNSR